jgi:hypothetical protein
MERSASFAGLEDRLDEFFGGPGGKQRVGGRGESGFL